jgi:hypothetical protein
MSSLNSRLALSFCDVARAKFPLNSRSCPSGNRIGDIQHPFEDGFFFVGGLEVRFQNPHGLGVLRVLAWPNPVVDVLDHHQAAVLL